MLNILNAQFCHSSELIQIKFKVAVCNHNKSRVKRSDTPFRNVSEVSKDFRKKKKKAIIGETREACAKSAKLL